MRTRSSVELYLHSGIINDTPSLKFLVDFGVCVSPEFFGPFSLGKQAGKNPPNNPPKNGCNLDWWAKNW